MLAKVDESLDSLDDLISRIKESSSDIGAILIFIGVVRGQAKTGERVLHLEYTAHETLAPRVLEKVLRRVISKYGIIDAIAEHKIGRVPVGGDIMYVLVASRHREEGFAALKDLVDSIKHEVPIWKKEVTEQRSYWVEGEKVDP